MGLLGHISQEDRDSNIMDCFMGTCKDIFCSCNFKLVQPKKKPKKKSKKKDK